MDVWDPERVQTLGNIMPRYAPYVRPGDLLTLGVEGDPCNVYGSNEHVKVAEVWTDGGEVRFRATREGHDDMMLDAMSVDPKKTWEVHKDWLDKVAERVAPYRSTEQDDGRSSVAYRASVHSRLEGIDADIKGLKEALKGTTEQLRLFAEDITKGDKSFSKTYAATYDRFGGDGEKTNFLVDNHTHEKTDFTVDDENRFGNTRVERKSRSSKQVQLTNDETTNAYAPFREVPVSSQ